MRPACPKHALGALLAAWISLGLGCRESTDEVVTPVEIAPEEGSTASNPTEVEQLKVEIVARHPHAPDAFTQGLLWHDGTMYESTGRYGHSSLRRVRLEDGEVLAQRDLEPNLFGEGLARVDDRLIQLTWRSGVAVVSDLDSLEARGSLRYSGEGWGLCFDGDVLIMSDGSAELKLRDPESMAILRRVTVRRNGRIVTKLNELECVGDAVYANVWQSDEILRINPTTGRVTGVIDANGLLSRLETIHADVLNGIAYRPDTETFLLTGKLWPHVFEVELVPH